MALAIACTIASLAQPVAFTHAFGANQGEQRHICHGHKCPRLPDPDVSQSRIGGESAQLKCYNYPPGWPMDKGDHPCPAPQELRHICHGRHGRCLDVQQPIPVPVGTPGQPVQKSDPPLQSGMIYKTVPGFKMEILHTPLDKNDPDHHVVEFFVGECLPFSNPSVTGPLTDEHSYLGWLNGDCHTGILYAGYHFPGNITDVIHKPTDWQITIAVPEAQAFPVG